MKRIQRVNQLIKKELSQILLREVNFPKDILVTITKVETSADLKESKIYISIIPEEIDQKVIQILNRIIYDLQQKLNKRLKMRTIPQIKFLEERQTSEAGRIEEILEKIKNSKNP